MEKHLVSAGDYRLLTLRFRGLHGGLFLMFTAGLLPIGILQIWYSYEQGFPTRVRSELGATAGGRE